MFESKLLSALAGILLCAPALVGQNTELVLRCSFVTPVPGSETAEDCLVAHKFDVEKVILGDTRAPTVVSVFWAKRFGRPCPAASLQVGDRIRLKGVDYALRARELEKHPRFDDTKDFDSPVLYATEWAKIEGDAKVAERAAPAVDDAAEDETPESADAGPMTLSPSLQRVLRVLASHAGEPIGSPDFHDGEIVFSDYEYLYRDEFWEVPNGSARRVVGPLRAIRTFAKQLDERGVELVTVFVPAAAAVYPGAATRVPHELAKDGRVDVFFLKVLDYLARHEIEAIDLLPTLAQLDRTQHGNRSFPTYLTSSPLWAPWAAAECAEVVAKRVRELPGLADAPLGRLHGTTSKRIQKVAQGTEVTRVRDYTTAQTLWHAVEPEPGAERILDANVVDAPVVVLGGGYATAFSGRQSSFRDHLALHLGLPVRAVEDRQRLKDVGIPASTKVVVWVISAASLADTSRWVRVNLAK